MSTPSPSPDLSNPAPFSRAEYAAILMCVGSTGGDMAERIADGAHEYLAALKVVLIAKAALQRVLGEELMRQMVDEDIAAALDVDMKDLPKD